MRVNGSSMRINGIFNRRTAGGSVSYLHSKKDLRKPDGIIPASDIIV
jgi:hypothetical protein